SLSYFTFSLSMCLHSSYSLTSYSYYSFHFFFFTHTAITVIYTLSLHDALPILVELAESIDRFGLLSPILVHIDDEGEYVLHQDRSEEHTSELQSRFDLVCRLLLEKKKKTNT